jgi:hemerythrin-like domain-containing protein
MKAPRREFLIASTVLGISGIAGGMARTFADPPDKSVGKADKKPEAEVEVSAAEDLMREHGVLNRILLIYDESVRRLRVKVELPSDVLRETAEIVRKFLEDYHSKLEENYIFPEFEKRNQMVPLVKTLRSQHAAGRAMTDIVLKNATPERLGKSEGRDEIVYACSQFVRMYRPHEAREDTIIFPALHKILTAETMDKLSDQFEAEEDRLFGDGGFEKNVAQVAEIEKKLGIFEIEQFTAKIEGK